MPDTTTVLLCDQRFHPPEPHLHFTREGSRTITFSTNLDYVSTMSDRLPGVFGKDDHVTGPLDDDEEEQPIIVAPHGSAPDWPIQPCDRHVSGPHYHVTFGGAAFNEDGHPSYNRGVHETDGWHTQQGVRYANPEWIAENAPPTVTVETEDSHVTLVEGGLYRCSSDAVDHSGDAVWLAFDGGSTQVRFRCMSSTGDAIVSGDAPTGGRTTQYVQPRFLSNILGMPEDDDGWGPGQKYRVTSTEGSHGFAVGTVVTSLYEPDHGSQNRLAYFHATTLDLDDYTQGSPQSIGTTAWVHGTDEYQGRPNVERIPEEVSRTRDTEEVDVEALLAELDGVEDAPIEIADKAAVVRDLQQRITQARESIDANRQERAEWTERLIERSRVVADREEWCGVYDAGMRELGLPDRHAAEPRTREVEVTVYAEIEVEVPINEDHVASILDGEGWDYRSVDGDTHYFTVNLDTVSMGVTVTVERDEDGDYADEPCACDEGIDWEAVLPNWVTDNGYSWSINERECSND